MRAKGQGFTAEFASPAESDAGVAVLSHRKCIKSFCKSQLPHQSVNLSIILVIIKDKMTDLCGN